tara:strand:+ start:613 stop:750 length:138 start_codon:yes stop_codon:yes gene_type:complete
MSWVWLASIEMLLGSLLAGVALVAMIGSIAKARLRLLGKNDLFVY